MKRNHMLVVADALFTLLCLITIFCWYIHIPYRIEVTIVLGLLAVAVLVFMKKGVEVDAQESKEYFTLLENENHFRSVFNYAASGMALISKNGHFLKVNNSLCQILGYSENELLSLSIRKLVYAEDFKNVIQKIRKIFTGEIKSGQTLLRCHTKNNESLWIMARYSFINDTENKPLYFVAQFENVNVTQLENAEANNLLYNDQLTGLANRTLLDQHINSMITMAKQNDKYFSIFLLDLDFFKNVNESIGHEAGDILLKTVAERIKSIVRGEDIVGRIGGDEFVIVVNNINKIEIIAQIAQKVLSNLLKAIIINGREVYITASIGVASYPNDGQDIETLIQKADIALYRAKKNGGNNYQFCIADMTQKAQEKTKQQSSLSNAMVKNELQLYYQPSVHAIDQNIISVEALIRWDSKEYGLVMPDTIIPLAEESGLIAPLSEWILRTACKQVKTWQEQGFHNIKLAINLSAYQFKNANFMNNVIRALRECEFSPQSLVLEITEGLIMHDHENTISILTKLKEEGITIVVDDFGTGFSSFTYLTHYSIDKIKIDQQFIHEMSKGNSEVAIVSAMISMANKLGIKSVAEGVETKEQYDTLVKEGCNEIQGYYIAKPMPIELMETFLVSRGDKVSHKNLP